MTRDTKERSFLATFRQGGSLGAQLVTGIAFVPIMSMFAKPQVGYQVAAAIMALVGVLGFFICYKNMILMTLFTISAMNTNNQMMIFFCQYNLGGAGLTSVFNFVMIGCSVAGISMIPKLVEKFGKKKTAIGGLLVAIVADAINFFKSTDVVPFMILVTIGYVGLAIPNGFTWAFVTDTTDTGYVANAQQSEATLMGIKGAMTLYPAITLALALSTLLFLYNLSNEKYNKIADNLSNGK